MLEASSYGTTTVQQYVYDCIRKDVTGDKILDYFYRGENIDSIDSYLASWRITIDRDSGAARAIAVNVKNEMIRYRAKEVEMQRAEEQNVARINHFIELLGMLQSEELQADVIAKYDISDFEKKKELISVLVPKLSPAAILSLYEGKACSENRMTGVINEESDEGKVLFKSIPEDKLLRCLNVFSSKGYDTSYLVARINNATDKRAMADEIVGSLNNKTLNERAVAEYVEKMGDGEATIALYDAAIGSALKQLIFSKLNVADRKTIRDGNIEKCKQMIEDAKSKSKETFEMGGFYLGMDVADADILIGYYFPEWITQVGVDSDEEDIRVVNVPQQRRPFCRANKEGKVWQFNFGKGILKKFFKYDVQDEREWALAYSKEHGINMKHVFLNDETSVIELSGNLSVSTTYKAWLNQDTWQWKNNAKGYRLVYFAKPNIETIHGNIVRQQALYQFRFVSADAGTLRVSVEND